MTESVAVNILDMFAKISWMWTSTSATLVGFPSARGGVLASGGREGTPVETLHKAQEQLQHDVSEN